MNYQLNKKIALIVINFCLAFTTVVLAKSKNAHEILRKSKAPIHITGMIKDGKSGIKNSPQNISFFENEQISVTLSNRDINRILVQGDKIQNINAPLGLYTAKNDNSGSLYVALNGSLPFTMYLNTTSGHNLSLFINPRSVIGKSIILQPTTHPVSFVNTEEKSDYQKILITLIKGMINHAVPEGYVYSFISKQKNIDFHGIANLKPIELYIGANLVGMVFEITNHAKTTIQLKPSNFYKPGVKAVALSLQVLEKDKKGFVYEVVSREQHN